MTLISIIIPHYNQTELLKLCLDSLLRQAFSMEACEIIVADNATPGGIEQIAAVYPQVRFVTEPERGAAAARNAALDVATGDIIAFIDSDCIADEDWLSAGISALEADGVDMVGGAIRVTCANPAHPTPEERFEQIFAFRQQDYITQKGFSVTANLIVKRIVADQVGGFRHAVSEDLDWCHRARALGFRLVFDGKAIISHPARADWAELKAKWLRLIREAYALDQQTHRSALRWRLRACVVAISAIPHMPRVLVHPSGGGIRARGKVMGVLVRQRLWRARTMLEVLREAKAGAPGWTRAEVAFRDDR